MQLENKVSWKKMRYKCSMKDLAFKSTDEITTSEGIIGQNRAAQALQFGLAMKQQGYNIFVCGPNGTGKSTYVKTLINEIAKNEITPDDWCYLYNFDNPDSPIAVKLPSGEGIKLKNDLENLIHYLKNAIPKAFSDEEHEKMKDLILSDYSNKSTAMYDGLEQDAKVENFTVTRTREGLGITPLVDGKPLSEDEYDALEEKEKCKWTESSKKMQQVLSHFIKEHKSLEKFLKNQLRELDEGLGVAIVDQIISEIKEQYKGHPQIFAHLEKMHKDLVKNIDVFLPKEEETVILPILKRDGEEILRRYSINLLTNNSDNPGAPVIIETSPSYQNILGYIEYHGEFGAFLTDFTRIRAGALHLANGGYLIIKAEDIFKYPLVWENLKKALLNKEIKVTDPNRSLGISITATLQPEAIPLQVKLILIGEARLYYLLLKYDADFSKLFKIKAEFDTEMPNTAENVCKYAAFVADLVKQHKLKPFAKSAIARIVEYGSEITDDQTRLSTRFNKVTEVIYEAEQWAVMDKVKIVTGKYVDKAINEKRYRANQFEEKITQSIVDESILIDVTGSKVGEVNALSVYNVGDYMFGRPSKITAKTYMGRNGIINIEREADLSGKIHNKGVLILAGYLGEKFAKNKPLALSASIAFEQSYGGIDGDSASAAELIAILSSITNIPIKQNYAITGSINQNGEIQPIGGINEKIEGFFQICSVKGISEKHGVIIPHKNLNNLMLNEEVIKSAKENIFEVYTVSHVDEALYLLTGIPAEKIYQKADQVLNSWAKDFKIEKKGKI